jgi:hypothetical protein
MYLTSHRIRTDHEQEGINASLYVHNVVIEDPDAALDGLETEPGVLKAAACVVPPGNIPVLAYLDIVADDSVRLQELEAVRLTAGEFLAKKPNEVPFRIKAGRVVVQFGCTIGRRRSRQHERDYAELWDRALFVFQTRPLPPWMDGKPIAIEVWQEDDKRIYQPSVDSMARLRLRHGPRWKSKRLTIDIFDQLDFEHYHGDLSPEAVSTLTDLSLNELAAFGGVKVQVRGNPGQVLFEWPPVAHVD